MADGPQDAKPRQKPKPPKGRGGPRPGSGRKPNEYKAWLGKLLDSPEHRAAFEREIQGQGTDKGFAFATKHAAAYAKGLPAQPITGPDGEPLTIRLVRE